MVLKSKLLKIDKIIRRGWFISTITVNLAIYSMVNLSLLPFSLSRSQSRFYLIRSIFGAILLLEKTSISIWYLNCAKCNTHLFIFCVITEVNYWNINKMHYFPALENFIIDRIYIGIFSIYPGTDTIAKCEPLKSAVLGMSAIRTFFHFEY